MKVLVTGGSGFLGSHVADALTSAGHEVTIFDRQPSPWLQSGQRFVEGDLESESSLEEALQGQEAVYHFAALADLDQCVNQPILAAQLNVMGSIRLAERCLALGIRRFLFGSTVYVYSRSGSFYRASKQAAETFLEEFQEQEGLELTILRYGSLYGPRAGANNSIGKLLGQAWEHGRIVYHGTGEERREFIHVLDAARASVEALQSQYAGTCLTLTGPEVYRYHEILELLQEMWPTPLTVELQPSERKAHYHLTPYQYAPRSGQKLIVNPFTDLGQGLLDCLNEMQQRKNHAH